MHITPTQASAIAVTCAIVFGCMIVSFNIGRYDAAVKIRSACDVDNRSHLKAGYYTLVRE
jgi:hypothetical protein